MKPVLLIAQLILVWFIPAALGADDPVDYQESPVERTSYTDENAPPGVELMVFLTWFTVEDIDHDSVIRSKLLDGEFRAEKHDELLAYFEDLRSRIESEIDLEMWQMACHEQADQLNAVEVRAIWNAFEDLRHGIYAKYIAIASGELAALGYVDFPEKLELMETGFSSTGYDYRDTKLISDQRILEARPQICKGLKSRMSSALD